MDKKPRILIFSTAYLPHIGGAELAVDEITDRLSQISFTMITARLKPDLPAHERVGNVEVYRVGNGNGLDKFRLFFAGVRKARSLGHFDLVWAIMASYAGFAALRYKKAHPDVPYLLTLQEGDSRWDIYKHVWWCWPYFTQIFKKADHIQAISNYLATWAKKLGAKCPIDVVPNGASFFADNIIEKESIVHKDNNIISAKVKPIFLTAIDQINKKYNLKADDILILTVSRLVKKNGIADLIKAVHYLPNNYKLRIVGTGELEDELKNLVGRLKLNQRVFFEGLVDHNEIWKYFWGARIFVRPSLSEGIGSAFFEAMHFRKPVVATLVGGIVDFLKDGETGWVCNVGDPKSIAEEIMYISDANNKEHVKAVVDNAQRMVMQKYKWERVAEQMDELFGKLL